MKKLYILTLCAIVAASASAASPIRFAQKRIAKKSANKTMVASIRDAAKIWRPVSATEYMFDGEDWLMLGESQFTYDTKGNVLTQIFEEDGVSMVTTSTYNDDNMVVSRVEAECVEGEEPQYLSKRTYVYDPIVKDYFIERMGYDWNGDEWEQNYFCEINDITRNSQGNIVEIVKKIPYDGEMSPAYKSVWHYNAETGEADEYAYYYNANPGSPEWELYDDLAYKNILWENTDGQMTKDFEELFEGANRIKQADVYFEDEIDGHIFATYSGDNDYVIKQTYLDPTMVGAEVVRKTLDENGSYSYAAYLYVDDDDNLTDEPFISEIETVTIDSHGNIVEVSYEEIYDGEPVGVASERYDYTYDDNGNATELVVSYFDEEEDSYIAVMRTVYGEYIDVTAGTSGIENITADAVNAVEIYNLNGVKVGQSADRLAKGIYIVRNGSSVSKIAVK